MLPIKSISPPDHGALRLAARELPCGRSKPKAAGQGSWRKRRLWDRKLTVQQAQQERARVANRGSESFSTQELEESEDQSHSICECQKGGTKQPSLRFKISLDAFFNWA
jgi:hypothetical protein